MDNKVDQILLIDDDEITNFIHLHLIQESGICDDVKIAKNGQEALNLIKSSILNMHTPPEKLYVFLDLNMPVMDGYEFLKVLSDEGCLEQLKIYVLTSSSHSKDMKFVEQFNVKGYISKPLTEEKLHLLDIAS